MHQNPDRDTSGYKTPHANLRFGQNNISLLNIVAHIISSTRKLIWYRELKLIWYRKLKLIDFALKFAGSSNPIIHWLMDTEKEAQ